MADKLELLLEAERRGLLPQDKIDSLNEARKRGLVPSLEKPQEEDSFFGNLASSAMGAVQKGKAGWDTLAGGLAGLVGAKEDSEKLFDQAVSNIKEGNLKTKEGVGGTVGSILGGIPTFLAQVPAMNTETQMQLTEGGLSPDQAATAAQGVNVLGSVVNAYGMAPAKSAITNAVRGGAGGAIQHMGSDYIKARTAQAAGDEDAARYFSSPEDYLKSAAIGAGVAGGASVLPKMAKKFYSKSEQTKAKVEDIKLKARDNAISNLKAKMEQQQAQQTIQEANIPADELVNTEEMRSPYGDPMDLSRVDENGMPINQRASEEIAMQGDQELFSGENLARTDIQNIGPRGVNEPQLRRNPQEVSAPDWATEGAVSRRNRPELTADELNARIAQEGPTPELLRAQQELSLFNNKELPYTIPEEVLKQVLSKTTKQDTIPTQLELPVNGRQRGSWSPFAGEDEQINIGGAPMARPPENFQTERMVPLKDGNQAIIAYDGELNRLTAYDPVTGKEMGYLDPANLPGNLRQGENATIGSVKTQEAYQNRGVATALGDAFKELFEGRVQASNVRTAEGRAWGEKFWSDKERGAFNPFAKKREEEGYRVPGLKELHNVDRLVTKDVPWDQVRDEYLSNQGADLDRKAIGLLSNRQQGTVHGGPLKWATDQMNIARGTIRSTFRDLAFGQNAQYGKLLKGLPTVFETNDGGISGLTKLTKQELNDVATTLHQLDSQDLPRRVTPEELKGLGLQDGQVQAIQNFWKMTDSVYDMVQEKLTALGRQDEIPAKRNNYMMSVREGNYEVPVYNKDGSLAAYFDFRDQADYKANQANMRQLLQENGINPSDVDFGPLAKIDEKYVVPATEKYFNPSGIYLGTGAKQHFQTKQSVLGARGSYGEEAGKYSVKAMESWMRRMENFTTRLDIRSRLEPMLKDPEITANFNNTADYVIREMDTFSGGGRKPGLGRTIEDAVKQKTGVDYPRMMQVGNMLFTSLKILGKPVDFMIQQIMPLVTNGIPRSLYLKGQLDSPVTVTRAFGKTAYSWMTGNMPMDQRSLLNTMAKRGLVDQASFKAIMHQGFGLEDTAGKVRTGYEKVADKLSRPEHAARAYLAMTLDTLLKPVIPDAKSRHETVMNHVTEAIGDMSPEGKILVNKENSRTLSAAYGPLTTFINNEIGQALLYAKGAKKDVKPILGYLGTRMALGGMASLPLVHASNAAVNFINENFDTDMPTLDKIFAGQPDVMYKGIPAAVTGLDMSSGARSALDTDYPFLPTLGWSAQTAKDAYAFLKNPEDQTAYWNLTKTLAPGHIKPYIEQQQAQDAADMLAQKGIVAPEGPTIKDRKGNAVATVQDTINPISLATGLKTMARDRAGLQENILRQEAAQFSKQRESLFDKMYTAWDKGDKEELQKLTKKTAELFVKNGIGDGDKIDAAIEQAIKTRLEKRNITKKTRDYQNQNSPDAYRRYQLENE